MTRHGGLVLAEMLRAHVVPRVFSVPGESFLAALDGFYETGLDNIVCRHEGGASMMAEATAKLTGRPGVAFVTRGPGASNAAAGVHIARQDSTPMVLFIGQIARGHRDREAFQEVDMRAMFAPLAKWAAEIETTDRIPEYVNRAFHIAMSGRPGPVVLSLPEDMLSADCAAPLLAPTAPARAAAGPDEAERVADFLSGAEKPLVVVGGQGWSQAAADDLRRWAEALALPVAVTFRRQDYFDNRSPSYVGDLAVGGNPALAAAVAAADRLVLIGTRFGDIPTGGYMRPDPASPGVAIAHIHPDPDTPGSVFRADLAITARGADMVAALAARRDNAPGGWQGWAETLRAGYEAWGRPRQTPGDVKLEEVMLWLSANLPDDAVITNGAGNYCTFVHRYYQFHRFGTQLAPTSGSMGYGFPAAIAACLHDPSRTVIAMAGDGCFQMTLNEMSTAIQHGAKPIVIVANNGRYGTIRAHQERKYPGRVSGTEMANPDFAALARAYGGHGETVAATADFPQAFQRARASGTPAVIELKLDHRMLGTTADLPDDAG